MTQCGEPTCQSTQEQNGSLLVEVREKTNDAYVVEAQVKIEGPTHASGTTDRKGRIVFENIPAGSYRVTATHEGFEPAPGKATAQVQPKRRQRCKLVLASRAVLEIVLDHDDDHVVDQSAPLAEYVRIGLWDHGYDAAGNIKNAAAESDNFVGSDKRRFYFRVRDPLANSSQLTMDWKTLNKSRADDDAPASLALTLIEHPSGSKVFVSKAVTLVTDDTDRDQPTNSGLPSPMADCGDRKYGESNHRTRRARIDGYVKGLYTPASGGTRLSVEAPVFNRSPDERKRLKIQVINYGGLATPQYISDQFVHANARWNQIGLQIDSASISTRPIPAGVLDATGKFKVQILGAAEKTALTDLISITPDNTLTVAFIPLSGANAYAAILPSMHPDLKDRFFVFIDVNLSLSDETLAHELHHVLFNRYDATTEDRYFTLNTNAPSGLSSSLPDVRIYRRIQNLHSTDPDNDPANDNIINWARRARTGRAPLGGGMGPATATTGNTLLVNY